MTTKRPPRNVKKRYQVWRSMDLGEMLVTSYDDLDGACEFCQALQDNEDNRRKNFSPVKMRSMPECFDFFYVEENGKEDVVWKPAQTV